MRLFRRGVEPQGENQGAPDTALRGTIDSILESTTGRARQVLEGVQQGRLRSGNVAGQGERDWLEIAKQRLSNTLQELERAAGRPSSPTNIQTEQAELRRVINLVENALATVKTGHERAA